MSRLLLTNTSSLNSTNISEIIINTLNDTIKINDANKSDTLINNTITLNEEEINTVN